ncbi:LemA family protein [Frankia sp. CNm7]|uniref:LemA family protein n=1 Tax=Frankia nepalensis TaxID=1836974 RepID=A0A937UR58_9ACTN|nr:LemA family protein [Frankia nepalensis]MBL7498355.1 LemA family protein [Frankia nepalensis]MBL7513236.1 LemA family protein [Frankia nepalensis]MBL7524067.1 LemA family protein [Frankia nepalensis]MBL7628920.1 LemA family protein [Frankia nepalensis]
MSTSVVLPVVGGVVVLALVRLAAWAVRARNHNAVQSLNAAVQSIPTSIVASLGRFHQEPYLEATAAARADLRLQF